VSLIKKGITQNAFLFTVDYLGPVRLNERRGAEVSIQNGAGSGSARKVAGPNRVTKIVAA
jgi:hypothetical protein